MHTLAASEGLDIQVRVVNPTGGEVSHKLNREVMLMVEQPIVYDRLLAVFLHDWAVATR